MLPAGLCAVIGSEGVIMMGKHHQYITASGPWYFRIMDFCWPLQQRSAIFSASQLLGLGHCNLEYYS